MRQREPRLLDPGYLAFLRTKRCCCCNAHAPSQAAHIRIGHYAGAMKPHDKHAVPLCAWCHLDGPQAEHNMGNSAEFWKLWELDPFEIAAKLYAEYGGDGGKPRSPRKIKPRKPNGERQKIQQRKTPWPKKMIPRKSSPKKSRRPSDR